jgi:hypothetical protein
VGSPPAPSSADGELARRLVDHEQQECLQRLDRVVGVEEHRGSFGQPIEATGQYCVEQIGLGREVAEDGPDADSGQRGDLLGRAGLALAGEDLVACSSCESVMD